MIVALYAFGGGALDIDDGTPGKEELGAYERNSYLQRRQERRER